MIISIIIFIYGLLIGSFLNVCIYRIPVGKSIVRPGSQCGSCGTFLKPIDLIPVLSWVFNRGRCRTCGAQVSAQYAVVEILTGVLTLIPYWVLGFSFELAIAYLLLWTGIVITFIDLEHLIIPDEINLFLAVCGGIYYIYQTILQGHFLVEPLLASLIGAGLLFIIAMIGAMGGGDIKYMAAVGLFLTPITMGIAIYISFILGGMIALILVIIGKYKRKMEIPFGPYLVIGTFVSFVYGNELIQAYIQWMQF